MRSEESTRFTITSLTFWVRSWWEMSRSNRSLFTPHFFPNSAWSIRSILTRPSSLKGSIRRGFISILWGETVSTTLSTWMIGSLLIQSPNYLLGDSIKRSLGRSYSWRLGWRKKEALEESKMLSLMSLSRLSGSRVIGQSRSQKKLNI